MFSQTVRVSRRAFSAATENLFKHQELESKHAKGLLGTWKKISLFVAIPAVGLAVLNAWSAPHPEIAEFKEYSHLRKRAKKFPWGDGNHSLFHSDHYNALPDGYHHSEEHH